MKLFASLPALKLALTACALAVAGPASAGLVYDNLGAAPEGSDPLLSYGPLANSFTTDAAGVLSGFSALLKNGSGAIVGDVRVSLHADSGANSPGVELMLIGLLSSAAIGTSDFAAYQFAPAGGLALAAHTAYWIEIEAATPNAVEWAWSGDLSGTGVAGQSNYSALFGSNPNSTMAPYQMAVDVSAVPEPASAALVLAALLAGGLARRRRC